MYYPSDPIENVKGVGKWIGKQFKKNGIKTAGDLINYFPFRHEDLSEIIKVSELEEGEKSVVKGEFSNISTFQTRTRKKMTKGKLTDDSGTIEVTWFNAPYIKSQIKEDQTYLVTCKPSRYGSRLNIVNPQIEKSEKNSAHTGRIVPIYFNINKVYPKKLRNIMFEVIENTEIIDFIEIGGNVRESTNYLPLKEAYQELHFPTSFKKIESAKDRIALNELLHVKLHSLKQKNIQNEQKTNFSIKKSYSKEFIKNLPFKLTKDQQESAKGIIEQLKSKIPMNTLLSGDVGSGKTIVSIIAANDVVKNGGKVVYLAPTVVLANQVYEEYKNKLKVESRKSKVKIELVTSQTSKSIASLFNGSIAKKRAKKDNRTIEQLNNVPDILIGTHALLNIEGLSEYANFVIIDEQHKFGVKQRAELVEDENAAHVLTMTATPIPRSMALAFFDELEVEQIKTKPKGRKKVITKVLPETKRKDCYSWLKKEVIKKQKVYHVVPFIEKSKAENFEDIKSIEEVKPVLEKEFGKNNVSILHGKLKDEKKEKIIADFKKKKGGILLSTQVVEVGIDVKEATVIIIESAERFGLASLHQLRGRVGRNDLQSYCFLFGSTKSKAESKRLKFLEKENNGFKLAQMDLENRGSGEIFGIRQSGEVDLKFVDFKNTKTIEEADKLAKEIYKNKKMLKEYSNNFFTREFFYIQDN